MAVYKQKEMVIQIPFTDSASIENAINCWCVLLHLGLEEGVIQDRMNLLKPVSMRLELLQGENNCIIINDAYSADLRSLSIGLDMLEQQKKQKIKTVFLSDMQQIGLPDKELYAEIAAILAQKNVSRLLRLVQH